MKIYHGLEELKQINNPVITIGTFDGVHLGHQKLISRLNKAAELLQGESVLLTFYPHPRMVLFPESHGLKLIQTQEEKLAKLRDTGLQNVIIVPFTKALSRMTALEFVRDILVNKLNVKKLVIGYDHQFGKNREGSIGFLKSVADTYGFEVDEIEAQEVDEMNVSSTKIRKAILAGEITQANRFLGAPFQLSGTVVKGNGLGKTIGFPTANIDLQSEIKLLPRKGVYAVELFLPHGEHFAGMMNLGTRPTVTSDEAISIEINIFDFDGDLYGQTVNVMVLSYIRDEIKFDSLESLKQQIKKDEIAVRNFFSVSV